MTDDETIRKLRAALESAGPYQQAELAEWLLESLRRNEMKRDELYPDNEGADARKRKYELLHAARLAARKAKLWFD